MEVIELVAEMQSICDRLRRAGRRIRLVPTMGALHIGHASLIRTAAREPLPGGGHEDQAKEEDVAEDIQGSNTDANVNYGLSSDRADSGVSGAKTPVIIVSIFANPMQFDRAADFEGYPKNDEADLKLCRDLRVDYVFKPNCEEMYPPLTGRSCRNTDLLAHGSDNSLSCCVVEPPTNLNNDLEGKSRKGHFRGMLTIVCKLFNITQPHEAFFGEKDYQQLVLVKRMVRDLNMNINIRPVVTIREPDMLPLSSRNVRMSEQERKAAPFMYKILLEARFMLETMDSNTLGPEYLDRILLASVITSRTLASKDDFELVHVDYLQLRCSSDFSKVVHRNQLFDCQEGCIEKQILAGRGDLILKTRLLISCIVGRNGTGIRLLDNIEVNFNKKYR